MRFTHKEELVPSIWQYFFVPERPVDFIPGQYTSFHMTRPLDDPRGQSRVFSFTSLPSDEHVSFVAKFVPPLSPYKQALQALQPDDELWVEDAMGDLVLPKLTSVPLVFIAGGIGLASYISMLRQLLTDREERQIFLFYAVRNQAEQIFTDVLGAYPLALKHITITPHRLTADEIVGSVPPDTFYYLSGSQRFVEGLQADFEQVGIPRERIVFDYFDGYTEL
ncbi:MAG TPA: FAD-dependent oxidoreductase [Candidatus Saccharimonadales bacterium]|nr:FAD-dependent oxidoreductase [Candidatus Saccharimonadales bacterium]